MKNAVPAPAESPDAEYPLWLSTGRVLEHSHLGSITRRESGQVAGRTPITKRGRAQLRAIVYTATLSSLRHNPRIKAHYERLCQRPTRPLSKMQAFGTCMTKLLLYAFAVVKHRQAFDVDHRWEEERIAA